jgi:hypothetical protein
MTMTALHAPRGPAPPALQLAVRVALLLPPLQAQQQVQLVCQQQLLLEGTGSQELPPRTCRHLIWECAQRMGPAHEC